MDVFSLTWLPPAERVAQFNQGRAWKTSGLVCKSIGLTTARVEHAVRQGQLVSPLLQMQICGGQVDGRTCCLRK